MGLRCFVAVELPEEVRSSVDRVVGPLRETGADVKWVPADNLHVTLKFLGDVEPETVEALNEELRKKLSHYRPFYIKIAHMGFFPAGRVPRVLWVGIEDCPALSDVQKEVERAAAGLGFLREDRPFSPHLTIGRVRSRKGIERMMTLLMKERETVFAELQVRGISLMRSDLKPAGAEYRCVAHIPFEGGTNVEQR